MKDLIFEQLKDIQGLTNLSKEQEEALIAIVNMWLELSNIVRKEGFLALEECVFNKDIDEKYRKKELNYFIENDLKQIIYLIVDGVDPELVEDISLLNYCTSKFDDFNKLISLICIVGGLSVQACEDPIVIRRKLISMLPSNIKVNYPKYI